MMFGGSLMKKILFVLLCSNLLLISNAYAGYRCGECVCMGERESMQEGGGFVDNSLKPMSVNEVDKLSDDSYVAMVGHIVRQTGEDKYEFSDGTNSIILKIKPKVWQGQKVSPKDKIMVMGEVDKEFVGKRMVKVKALKIVD